jgi:hypothetical protein
MDANNAQEAGLWDLLMGHEGNDTTQFAHQKEDVFRRRRSLVLCTTFDRQQ